MNRGTWAITSTFCVCALILIPSCTTPLPDEYQPARDRERVRYEHSQVTGPTNDDFEEQADLESSISESPVSGQTMHPPSLFTVWWRLSSLKSRIRKVEEETIAEFRRTLALIENASTDEREALLESQRRSSATLARGWNIRAELIHAAVTDLIENCCGPGDGTSGLRKTLRDHPLVSWTLLEAKTELQMEFFLLGLTEHQLRELDNSLHFDDS